MYLHFATSIRPNIPDIWLYTISSSLVGFAFVSHTFLYDLTIRLRSLDCFISRLHFIFVTLMMMVLFCLRDAGGTPLAAASCCVSYRLFAMFCRMENACGAVRWVSLMMETRRNERCTVLRFVGEIRSRFPQILDLSGFENWSSQLLSRVNLDFLNYNDWWRYFVWLKFDSTFIKSTRLY